MAKSANAGLTVAAHNLSQADLVQLCQTSTIGKCLPNAFYIHHSALPHLHESLVNQEQTARRLLEDPVPFTLVKFHFEQPKISYLYYPEFDAEPHPLLRSSTIVDWQTGTTETRDYSDAANTRYSTARKPLLPPAIPTTTASPT